jgi:hypothetical protein
VGLICCLRWIELRRSLELHRRSLLLNVSNSTGLIEVASDGSAECRANSWIGPPASHESQPITIATVQEGDVEPVSPA